MHGDITRLTFRPAQRFWAVLRQQGRVDLDADWNEQVRIANYHQTRRMADLVGAAGGPIDGAGFEVNVNPAGTVSIAAGRYYVDGILCENSEAVDFGAQPDDPGQAPPSTAGLHLAFLDVWDRHVTALDDPMLREVALGGPDTATRARTVWQVRTRLLTDSTVELKTAIAALAAAQAAGDGAAEAAALADIQALVYTAYCATPLEPVDGSLAPGTGKLAARARDFNGGAADPCRFEPGGGYRRLENRAYRVEIHDSGSQVEATYKWSRDNGSLVVFIDEFVVANPADATTTRIRVRQLGFDSVQELKVGDWVEIIGDDDELTTSRGTLAQIANQPDPSERILEFSQPIRVRSLELHPKVRRWDMVGNGGALALKTTWTALEDGVEIRFAAGMFHSGDYWVIPARANTADVEWPPFPSYPGEVVSGAPTLLPPYGIEHRRAPLAALVHDGAQIVAAVDLRRLFPFIGDLTALFYAGGDGQEPEFPVGLLPQPLQVAVGNGSGPIAGAKVEFDVIEGGGEIDAGAGFGAGPVVTSSDADGLASVRWKVDRAAVSHRVRARLLDHCSDPSHLPVFFNSRVNYQLHYLSGDGQEGLPGGTLLPLRVWVSDGRWPINGATVAFQVTRGGGALSTATAVTDADGIAECVWTLDAATYRQQVSARLLDGAGPSLVHDAEIVFNANLSRASEVSFDPAACAFMRHTSGGGQDGAFPDKPAQTVQQALDRLCPRVTLCEVGGDGQVAHLGAALDEPLRVEAYWGSRPLEGRAVDFVVIKGVAALSAASVVLKADGTAEVTVTRVDSTENGDLSIRATLADAPASATTPDPVIFHAHATASSSAGIKLEPFRRKDKGEPTPLFLDEMLSINDLCRGLLFASKDVIDVKSVDLRAIATVWVEVPYPVLESGEVMKIWQRYFVSGYKPILLAGTFSLLVKDPDLPDHLNVISWVPSLQTQRWLREVISNFILFGEGETFLTEKLLVRVSFNSNQISGGEDRERLIYVDPLFGVPNGGWPIALRPIPPGGGRAGDSCDLRFYIGNEKAKESRRFGFLPVRESAFFARFARAFDRDRLGNVFSSGTNKTLGVWRNVMPDLFFNPFPPLDPGGTNGLVTEIENSVGGIDPRAIQIVCFDQLQDIAKQITTDFATSTSGRLNLEFVSVTDRPADEARDFLSSGVPFDAVFAPVDELFALQIDPKFGSNFLPPLVMF